MITAGAILFLLGLLTGLVIPGLHNSRMGLASHLEGVMNGTFLIALGAVWNHLVLTRKLELAAFGLLVYGTYANWVFVLLAAIFGTSEMTPIAGKGYTGVAWQELLVSAGLGSVGVAMVVGVGILIYGFLTKE
jgi:(hydroxyamino)benzene mutase